MSQPLFWYFWYPAAILCTLCPSTTVQAEANPGRPLKENEPAGRQYVNAPAVAAGLAPSSNGQYLQRAHWQHTCWHSIVPASHTAKWTSGWIELIEFSKASWLSMGLNGLWKAHLDANLQHVIRLIPTHTWQHHRWEHF